MWLSGPGIRTPIPISIPIPFIPNPIQNQNPAKA